MSIAVAMKTAHELCVMCDSRTTFADGSTRDDTVKVHSIRFDDGNQIVVVRVGIDEFSGQLIDIMLAQSKGRAFKDLWAGAELASDAIIELKDRIRQGYHGTAEELQRHFLEHNFELMVAYYFERKPYLFTVDFALGSWTRRTQNYFAIGCGKTLADFLLYDIKIAHFSTSNAIWTGAYIVESVKRVDSRCGGPIRGMFAMLWNEKSVVAEMLALNLDQTVAQVTEFFEEQRFSWKSVVEDEEEKHRMKAIKRARRELKRNNYIVGYAEGDVPIRADPKTGSAVIPPDTKVLVSALLPLRKRKRIRIKKSERKN